jgi:hypothetical protein
VYTGISGDEGWLIGEEQVCHLYTPLGLALLSDDTPSIQLNRDTAGLW